MKFYVVSDLHLDMHTIRKDHWYDFERDAILFLAGDSANGLAAMAYVKNILCKHFRAVVMVAGNHEWYSNKNRLYRMNPYAFQKESINNVDYATVIKNSPLVKLKAHSKKIDNLYFLDNELIEIEGFKIYGGSLWFPIHTYSAEIITEYEELMNDAKFINYRIIEEQYKAFIDNFPTKVDLVISHHLPCHEAFALEKNANSEYALFYHASLSHELISSARYWIAGHQHEAIEKKIAGGKTTFISNPKGAISMHPGLLSNKKYFL
ncbi:metallophosphoesterase [Shewanella sp. 10N.286.51.B2]|uniref:metallophosphoesterase n=1 Tax=Shewanella sp. 10N.286.51.B2 TaxID=3229707 RepID=UPI00354F48D4